MKVKDKPYKEGVDILNANIDDPKTLLKAMGNLDSYRKRMEGSVEDSSKTNANAVIKIILDRQNGGNRFIDVNEMHNDPTIKMLLPKINNSKDLITIDKMIEPPNKSDPDALQKSIDLIKNANVSFDPVNPNSGLKDMPADELLRHKSLLNSADAKVLENAWKDWNGAKPSDVAKQTTAMTKMLEDAMLKTGVDNRAVGVHKNQMGKYNTKDQIKLHDAVAELHQQLANSPMLSEKDRQQKVQDFMADKIKNSASTGWWGSSISNAVTGFFKPTEKTTPIPNTTNIPGVVPTPANLDNKKKAMTDFYKINKRWPDPKTTELQDFMKKQGK